MRLLVGFLLTLFVVLPVTPASAAVDCAVTPLQCRCVTAVFHRPWLSPTNNADMQAVTVRWQNVERLGNRQIARANGQRKLTAAFYIWFDTFGNLASTTFNPEDSRIGLRFISPTGSEPRDMLFYGVWSLGANRSQDSGSRNWLVAPLDDTEGETAPFDLESGTLSQSVNVGTTTVLFGVATDALRLRGDELFDSVETDLLANGC
jgi:hypothetical protein